MTTTAQRHLTDAQIAGYHRDGYLAVPRLIDADRVEALRRLTAAFVEHSRGISRSDAVFDLDPRHTAATPILRRIKNPADHDPLYAWVALESPILDVVAELIGPSLRFHHSKLNLKGSLIGAPVEVHQDAAFYPHSNDDVLAVGLLLDDATAENGAMAVHWSAPNTSPGDRRLLINAYAAADAVPLAADPTGSPRYGRLVRGTYPAVARRTAGEMPMPPDFSRGYTSIYELQNEGAGPTT